MPTTSGKVEVEKLLLYLGFESFLEENNAILSSEDVMLMLGLLKCKRYSIPRFFNNKKHNWWKEELFGDDYDFQTFQSNFRMSRPNFWKLCSMLSEKPCFANNKEQIFLQIAITLYRFGHDGNASSLQQISSKFGVAKGSVHLFTKRTIQAIRTLSSSLITWPTVEERKLIGDEMACIGLPKCIGFVDGSDVPLHNAPLMDKETYWSRKKHYSMQFQIVCDPSKRIRDFFVGYPGSVHDSKVYKSTLLSIQPENYFSSGEYIIGDSAYALTDTVVGPFKSMGIGLSADHKRFNQHISSQRVKVEHAIGILKSRFQSLKGLRILICPQKGHKYACEWIQACVILHNFLIGFDDWNEEITEDANLENDEPLLEDQNRNHTGQEKRNALFQIFKTLHNA